MRQRTPIAVRTYELDPVDRHRLVDSTSICHGQAPHSRPGPSASDGRDADPMSLSLHLADGGSLLVLYRSGYPAQAIRVNEVIADWLRALHETWPDRPSDERLAEIGREAIGAIWARKTAEREEAAGGLLLLISLQERQGHLDAPSADQARRLVARLLGYATPEGG